MVIPLPRMGEYTEGIERINIELSLRNKLELVDALEHFFARGAVIGEHADLDQAVGVERAAALLREHAQGTRNWHTQIWNLMMLESWHRQFVDQAQPQAVAI